MKNEILDWSDELATGILWQDFQHAELRNYDGTGAQMKAASLCYDLYEWVTHHIRTTDKALGHLLQQKALQ